MIAAIARTSVLVTGIGLAVIVGHDGSPHWQIARVAAVAVLCAACLGALGRRRGRPTALLAVGLIGIPVGVGIALPHVAKSGNLLIALAGLAVLGGSLTALVVGTAVLLRSTRLRWRVPIAFGLVATLYVTLVTLGVATAATNVPRTALDDRTPASVGLTYRPVTFETADGVELSGWYVPSRNGAACVLAHGAGSTRSSVLEQAAVLARSGYGVLLFDARGHGRSEGRAMDLGWYGDLDVGAAVTFLTEQPDVDAQRIAAVGLSMGGEEVIGAAASDPRIRAVVAEGATGRTAGDEAWLSEVHGWRGSVQQGIERAQDAMVDLLTGARPPIALRSAAAAAAPRPIFLIAAGRVATETHAGRAIRSGSPDTVELWTVPEAGHTDGLDRQPADWERRVTDFLARALDLPA